MSSDIGKSCLALLLSILTAGCGGGGRGSNDGSDGNDSVGQSIVPIATTNPIANVFQDRRIVEASGIQRSLLVDGIYYVHNDRGADPIIYATNSTGAALGTINVTGVDAIDWEGIAGTRRDGISRLIVGDIGNNDRQRSELGLVVIDEPDVRELARGFDIDIAGRRIQLTYADGVLYDAEALFIKGDNDTVVVITKNGQATEQQGVWQGSLSSGLADGGLVLEYRGFVALADDEVTNAITDIDIRRGGRELAVLTNGALNDGSRTGLVHLWIAQAGEGTADALQRNADRTISVPQIGSNTQAEAISYDPQGEYLLIGAEGGSTSVLTIVPNE